MISIIVPCYNCENTIDRCVESILNQTTKKYEIVLVNDGSVDKTGEICDKYSKEDERIKVVHQENRGLMAAWKHGVQLAMGEYIIFSDSDDWIEEDLLEKLERVIDRCRVDIITYGITVEYDKKKVFNKNNIPEGLYEKKDIEYKILPRYFSDGKMESGVIIPSRCCKAVRRQILIDNMKYLDDSFSIGEDDLTSFAIFTDVDSIYNIDNYYPYHYCRHHGSMMGNYSDDTVKKIQTVHQELVKIAKVRHFEYETQIDYYFIDNLLVIIKKILENRECLYLNKKEQLEKIRHIRQMDKFLCDAKTMTKKYGIREKILLELFRKQHYLAMYIGVKLATMV